MSIFEYDKEEEEKKLRKAEYEAGERAGIKLGKDLGRKEGKSEGRTEAIRETICNFLADYGTIPGELKEFLLKEQDEEKLFQWSKIAARVGSIEEFQKKIR